MRQSRIGYHLTGGLGVGGGGGELVEERGVEGRGVKGYWGVLARPDVHTFLLFTTASEIWGVEAFLGSMRFSCLKNTWAARLLSWNRVTACVWMGGGGGSRQAGKHRKRETGRRGGGGGRQTGKHRGGGEGQRQRGRRQTDREGKRERQTEREIPWYITEQNSL